MCLKFTALEIEEGDAFLIEDEGENILFDSGVDEKVCEKLRDKNIEKINLAICSHNDKDHAEGFIHLLDQKSWITVEEIWLPGQWAKILLFIKDLCHQYGTDDIIHRLLIDGEFIEDFVLPRNEEIHSESINDELEKFYKTTSIVNLHHLICHLCHCSRFSRMNHKLCLPMDRIIQIAHKAYLNNVTIKWFEPTKPKICSFADVGHNFKTLNSNEIIEIRKPIQTLKAFYQAVSLTMVNRYSLVFEYLKDGIPIIRFSADSNCTCQSTTYDNSIIVTAPHHGSTANRVVYNALKAKNDDTIIWVRSDKINHPKSRPCQEFKTRKNKYCLACSKLKFKQEIVFKYDFLSKVWKQRYGNKCGC